MTGLLISAGKLYRKQSSSDKPTHPWLKVRFVVRHRGQRGSRWVLLLVDSDWSATGGERGSGWRSCCSFYNTTGDDCLDSINRSWNMEGGGVILAPESDIHSLNRSGYICRSTNCPHALLSFLEHADTRVDLCKECGEEKNGVNKHE